jgi:DNA-binding transcriptional LysR family regulator
MQDEAIAAARSEVDPERGRVRLAAVTTAADHLLPAALGGFLRRHPDVDLRLEVGSSEQVWALFEAHETDVVIAGRPPRGRTGVIAATRPNELVAVAAPGPAADADPARTRWLLREPGSGTRATCETLLAELDADPPRLTLGSNGAVVAGAVAGLGVTLVSRDAVAHRLASGELRVVDLPGTPMIRPWHLVVHQPLPAGATLFVDHLLRHADPTGARWQPPAPPRRGPGGSPARPARPAR